MPNLDSPPLPKASPEQVRSAMLIVISLATCALTRARAAARQTGNPTTAGLAEIERLEQEVTLLREQLHIKDQRMAAIAPQR